MEPRVGMAACQRHQTCGRQRCLKVSVWSCTARNNLLSALPSFFFLIITHSRKRGAQMLLLTRCLYPFGREKCGWLFLGCCENPKESLAN